MTKEEFYLLNDLYNASKGRAIKTSDVFLNLVKKDAEVFNVLKESGLADGDTGELTPKGMDALQSYRVDNAVILAAGSSVRFVPLSLEQPKGLYEVKGEKLIERLIIQLQEAGITDITVVLGYKREMYEYLSDKFGVKLVFNPLYNLKNNIESLYVVRSELGNTYICTCDSYFTENPFNEYEYQPFYSGYMTDRLEDEMYVEIDDENRITCMQEKMNGGLMLLGHSFWNKAFSDKFIALAEEDRSEGRYDDQFWEWMVKDKLGELPAFFFKEYLPDMIHEFDYFEQLREFDTNYIGHTHSEIIRNIKLVFRCDEEDIVYFRTVSEGLTNISFVFRIDGVDYIYRHPGEGTESIINRRHEKQSLLKAYEYGLDPTYIYMDLNEGWKISKFVTEFRKPDYSDFDDSKKILEVLRKLHSLPIKVDYGMEPWEDAQRMEHLIKNKDPDCFEKYEALKERIGLIYRRTLGDGIEKCFCHGDTYRPNWMIKPDGEVILIDWEYAGYSDPGIDVGYYIVDAMYDMEDARRFIREYLGDKFSDKAEFHFLAYTAIIAYYWFVWAIYRESCGAVIGEEMNNWHKMAEKYSRYINENNDLEYLLV